MTIASKLNRKIKMKQRINKIKGKFYPLKHEEWLEACKKLKPSERDVLYYVRTLDPRNNGISISTTEIARALSTPKRKIHRRTVSRALKRLDQLGFLDLEIVAAQVKLRGGGLWSDDGAACGSRDRPNSEVDRLIQGVDQTIQGVDQTIQEVDQTIHPEIAKILTEKGIQRNSDFLDLIDLIDLSEGEGENFGEFCRRETAHFDPPLRSLPDYLASRDASGRPRYWPLWEKYQAANPNWRSHPHYEEWAAAIQRDGYGWVVQQFGQPEYSELVKFHEWYEQHSSL